MRKSLALALALALAGPVLAADNIAVPPGTWTDLGVGPLVVQNTSDQPIEVVIAGDVEP